MACPVVSAILFSNTVSWGRGQRRGLQIISIHYNNKNPATFQSEPHNANFFSHIILLIVLWMFSTCWKSVLPCESVCVCVLVGKCTNQIQNKIFYATFFCWGKESIYINIYLYIGIDIVLPSVFLGCFCTIFVPKKIEIVWQK